MVEFIAAVKGINTIEEAKYSDNDSKKSIAPDKVDHLKEMLKRDREKSNG